MTLTKIHIKNTNKRTQILSSDIDYIRLTVIISVSIESKTKKKLLNKIRIFNCQKTTQIYHKCCYDHQIVLKIIKLSVIHHFYQNYYIHKN